MIAGYSPAALLDSGDPFEFQLCILTELPVLANGGQSVNPPKNVNSPQKGTGHGHVCLPPACPAPRSPPPAGAARPRPARPRGAVTPRSLCPRPAAITRPRGAAAARGPAGALGAGPGGAYRERRPGGRWQRPSLLSAARPPRRCRLPAQAPACPAPPLPSRPLAYSEPENAGRQTRASIGCRSCQAGRQAARRDHFLASPKDSSEGG